MSRPFNQTRKIRKTEMPLLEPTKEKERGPASREEKKRKTEKNFRLSPLQYQDPCRIRTNFSGFG